MRLTWSRKNLVSRSWVKLTLTSERIYDGFDGERHHWHRTTLKPTCDEIVSFLDTQSEHWMFNPQSYLTNVQFAVEKETTALMIRMLCECAVQIESPMKLRGDQIRFKKGLDGIIDPYLPASGDAAG